MTSLILVRHGETDWNRAGRIQGLTDIPLNDTGRTQARDAAAVLRLDLQDAGTDAPARAALVSSDLLRARETAEIIAAELGLRSPRLYPGLRERAYGEAEGIDAAEFQRRYGPWHVADVPGAESRAALRVRAIAALRDALADAQSDHAGEGARLLIVVAHGALIREVIGHASDDLHPEPGVRLPNGSAHRFRVAGDELHLVVPAGVDPAEVETAARGGASVRP